MIKVVIWKAKTFDLKEGVYASNSVKYLNRYLSTMRDSLGMWSDVMWCEPP